MAEHIEPWNSLAPRTMAAISLGNSGNLLGGQMFLALDTGHTITQHQWVLHPMSPAVIARVNLLDKVEPSILTFTDWHGWEIGDHPQDLEPCGDDDGSADEHLQDVLPGVEPTPEDHAEVPGLDTNFDAKPTGVKVDSEYVSQEHTGVDGLRQQDQEVVPTETPSAKPSRQPSTEPIVEKQAVSPKKGMAACNVKYRKQSEKYVPSTIGNKYTVALTQIVALLKSSKHAMSMAQMLVKLMSPGSHRSANVAGMIMSQLSMKAAIKPWGQEAEYAMTKEMKQL